MKESSILNGTMDDFKKLYSNKAVMQKNFKIVFCVPSSFKIHPAYAVPIGYSIFRSNSGRFFRRIVLYLLYGLKTTFFQLILHFEKQGKVCWD